MHPDLFFNSIQPDFWTPEMQKEFSEHAIRMWPEEACATIINNQLVILENVADDPLNHVDINEKDTLRVMKSQGFIHSHPKGNISPSATDMQAYMQFKIPFGIITTSEDSASRPVWLSEKLYQAPLEGRPFIYNIFDCYTLGSSYYYQSKGIKLKLYPTNDRWWDDPKQDHYVQNFIDNGFRLLSHDEPIEEGDAILMNIGSLANSTHAAIYLGNDLIIHHLRGRISRKDRLSLWKKLITHRLRYVGK